jgi:sodium/potassium-transporting ATPase subunit alpha
MAYLDLDSSKYTKEYQFDEENDEPNFPVTGLTFVGFMSLVDPPRLSVKPSIVSCNKAGIQVFMVTGDHPITAHAIAKSLNLVSGPTQKELNE